MSKITVAFSSFMLAMCFSALLGIHTSTLAQPVALAARTKIPPQTSPPPPGRQQQYEVFDVFGDEFVPKVPGLAPMLFHDNMVVGTRQGFDGFHCKDSSFRDVVFVYSGGAVSLENCTFSGTTRLELHGAAANTVAVISFLQAMGRGEPFNPKAPALHMAKADIKTATIRSFKTPDVRSGE